ncbi:hypothetical protein CA12_33080 [Alienimonas californiensis]|uniref:DUF1573 domain-containing protein n=1 Tax=Alienimonas californiensis TaxID=2527989 RepID=A0A517PCW1_9PLAN|nr:hypothetical protein CA12_33080 [Alienimonas californiensis]
MAVVCARVISQGCRVLVFLLLGAGCSSRENGPLVSVEEGSTVNVLLLSGGKGGLEAAGESFHLSNESGRALVLRISGVSCGCIDVSAKPAGDLHAGLVVPAGAVLDVRVSSRAWSVPGRHRGEVTLAASAQGGGGEAETVALAAVVEVLPDFDVRPSQIVVHSPAGGDEPAVKQVDVRGYSREGSPQWEDVVVTNAPPGAAIRQTGHTREAWGEGITQDHWQFEYEHRTSSQTSSTLGEMSHFVLRFEGSRTGGETTSAETSVIERRVRSGLRVPDTLRLTNRADGSRAGHAVVYSLDGKPFRLLRLSAPPGYDVSAEPGTVSSSRMHRIVVRPAALERGVGVESAVLRLWTDYPEAKDISIPIE